MRKQPRAGRQRKKNRDVDTLSRPAPAGKQMDEKQQLLRHLAASHEQVHELLGRHISILPGTSAKQTWFDDASVLEQRLHSSLMAVAGASFLTPEQKSVYFLRVEESLAALCQRRSEITSRIELLATPLLEITSQGKVIPEKPARRSRDTLYDAKTIYEGYEVSAPATRRRAKPPRAPSGPDADDYFDTPITSR